jgi:hypothetical protein
MMLPGAGLSASLLTYLTSLPNLLPMLVLVLAIFAGENAWLGLIPVVFFYGMLIICDRAYLGTKTPWWGWILWPPPAAANLRNMYGLAHVYLNEEVEACSRLLRRQ